MKRVNVNIPPEVLETSRALQAANRDRLVRRERDERTRREAERQARQAREEQARSSAGGKKDPRNRGVPDVEDPPFFPLQRRQKFEVAGAYCQVELGQLRVFTPDRQVSAVIPAPGFVRTTYANDYFRMRSNGTSTFPAFVVAIPGGAGRTVITFCFDTWDYSEAYHHLSREAQALTQYHERIGRTIIVRRDMILNDFRNAIAFKSCVVTDDRINIIDTPPVMSTILKRLYPRKDPAIEISTNYRPLNTYNTTRWSWLDRKRVDVYRWSWADGADADSYEYIASIDYGEDTNFYDRLLLSSYGYGYLVNREPTTAAANIKASIGQAISNGQSPSSIASLNSTPVQLDNRGFATPAVFAFMRKYQGEFDGGNATRSEAMDYQYISDNYFSGSLAGGATGSGPRYMLTVGYQPEDVETDKTTNLFYFRPPLDTNTFLAPPILPKEGKGADEERVMAAPPLPNMGRRAFSSLWDWKLIRGMKAQGYGYSDSSIIQATSSASVGEATAINTWDWGRPLACILELLSLGFSPAALMLTAEELEAVANATPADRFNFSSSPP